MNPRTLLVYDDGYLRYDFGAAHAMHQERVKLARELIADLGLLEQDGVSEEGAEEAHEEILSIHSEGYVEAVKVAGANPSEVDWQYLQYGLGTSDNPLFPDMYGASAIHVGGSLRAVRAVLDEAVGHAFNLGGGFHHALRERASGFCIFNDPAIAIQDLLDRGVRRVLYVDVDAHHGDGVQAAFYTEPRVMTVSFHEDGRYLFPGTGFLGEVGEGEGEGYSVNVPLPPYTGDAPYLEALNRLLPPLAEAFQPEFMVTQFGADTHFLDPLTHLHLTTQGHHAIAGVLHNLAHTVCQGRWVALGGGGYDIAAVARGWTLVFAAMVEWEVEDRLPEAWLATFETLTGTKATATSLFDGEPPSRDEVGPKVTRVVDEVEQVLGAYHAL